MSRFGRGSLSLIVLAVLALTGGPLQAQGTRSQSKPPKGSPRRPFAGGDSIPPWITLTAPSGDVFVQYPQIKIQWCDDQTLVTGSRSIKVNGTSRTTSFDYNTGQASDCGGYPASASSQSTTVPLNFGQNSVEAYICDQWGP